MVFKSRTVAMLVIAALVIGVLLTQTYDSINALIRPAQHDEESNGSDVQSNDKNVAAMWKKSGLTEEQLNKIAYTYYLINNRFYEEADAKKVLDGAINGMLASLEDPHTVYMDEEEAKQFSEAVYDSSFTGIGAEVMVEDGKVTVVSPIKGSPAEKAGIHAKDIILSVNGEKLEGLTLNESVARIRGPKGTQAKLEIIRDGNLEAIEIIVVRDEVDLETVYSSMSDDNGIGIIEIRRFAVNTATRFLEDLAELEAKGMTSLIIDVRNNPGGILQVVVEMLEPLIPKGKVIVQTEERDGRRNASISKSGSGKNYPIVVLTNKGSASASEILAAALQEATDNIVIGEATYGKGTVQSPFELGTKDGSNIKMTISKWLTPDGNFINEVGVIPNMVVEQPDFFYSISFPKDVELRADMLGGLVANLQIMLNGLGYETDRKDGYYSEQTKLAVEAFQEEHELAVTGEVDHLTAAKLESEIIKAINLEENDLQMQKALEYLSKR